MKYYDNKLVILRGNSCTGKSTTASALREQAEDPRKIALIGQDHFRRTVLKELDGTDNHTITLLKENVIFCLERDYDVILEGILKSDIYGQMIQELQIICPNNFIYYFDIPLEETFKRRRTREDGDQFTDKQMRNWYLDKDYLGTKEEVVIDNSMLSKEDIVKRISKEALL